MYRRALSAFTVGRVPSSVRRPNSYKSGVCVSRRVATMGVKVGGVESAGVPPAPGSPDQWIGLPRGLQGRAEKRELALNG